jgi:Peptidase A4 family
MTKLVGAVFTVAVLLASSSAHATRSRNDPVAVSAHWAGYVARVDGSVAHVSGRWVQPRIVCDRPNSSAAFWVGLGGARAESERLEQIGTSVDCSASMSASYSAWYELFPARAVEIPLLIRSGDLMTAEVGVDGDAVTLRLRNTSTGESFSTVQVIAGPEVDSAEWIVEAPSVCFATCASMPLARFDRVRFTDANAGATHDWQRFELRGASACAVPLARSADGSAFAVVQSTSHNAKRRCGPKRLDS